MKKYLTLLLGAIAITSCITSDRAEGGADEKGEGIYYKTQSAADVALASFDRANPSCQLWTNWQKMCSRTGESEETSCQKAQSSVKPSVPFCVINGDIDRNLDQNYSAYQLKSYLRFCEEKTGEIIQSNVPACKWSKERPFSGLNVTDLKHPWCKQWKLTISESINPELSKEMGYYCADRAVPVWCEWGEGMGKGRQLSDKPSSENIIAMGLSDPNYRAVNGPYCYRRLKNAAK